MESSKSSQEVKQYPIINSMEREEYDIFVIKTNKNILIRYLFYETELDINDLALLTNKKYKTIGEYFAYFDSIFLENNFYIDIDSNYELIIENNGYQKKVEIPLYKRKEYNDYIIEKLNNRINELEYDNYILRYQIKNIKSELKKEVENLKMEIKNLFQQQMKPMMNNFGCFNFNNPNIITILFQLENNQKKIFVQSFYNDTLSSLINKFYLEYGYENSKMGITFLFNGRKLSPDSNVTLANLGIQNLSMISVLENHNLNSNEYVYFRHSDSESNKQPPALIAFRPNELVSTLIARYRKFSGNMSKNIKFIFNAKGLNTKFSRTCEEVELTTKASIFVVYCPIDIIFKISYKKELFCPLNVQIKPNDIISKLIELYLTKSNINRKDIEYFTSNSQKVKENLTIEELNLENKSEILVISKKRFDTIFINFRIYNKESNIARIECLKSYLISTLIEQFNKLTKLNLDEEYFIYNGKELNKNMSVEEAGLKNNDIVYFTKFKFIKN